MKTYGKIHWKVESITCFVKQGKTVMRSETDEAHADLVRDDKTATRMISFKEISSI
ncbi:hypothetical protein [Desulforegula conservatrix]|uniref:hypothetical protein n=1 Tax=Desulforegula conservatrix TaxID=153026 RepID=UPI000403B986|nr:hypothetical protein [Desulforegula conservatrix]